MKAEEKIFLRFLEGSDTKFIIPVYQRNYDWKKEQCKKLFDDLLDVIKYNYSSHFLGVIVAINQSRYEYLIIDGQQRLTTVSLLLLAIHNLMKENEIEIIPEIKDKIIELYLKNKYKDYIKLIPIQKDRIAYEKLFSNFKDEYIEESNITINYEYFYERIKNEVRDKVQELFDAIDKLMIVEVELKPKEDDPQLIFESLNSTGLDLNEGDKVRNYILMGRSSNEQEKLYNDYWHKIEENTEYNVSGFIRDYLTLKISTIYSISKVYFSFKDYTKTLIIEEVLKDMLNISKAYKIILKSDIGVNRINKELRNLSKLEMGVINPYLMQVIMDFKHEIISEDDFIEILKILQSYIFRRLICDVPTNALNKVFMTLSKDIKKHEDYKENYVEILKFILKSKESSQRFPLDEDFKTNYISKDIYNMKPKNKYYILELLENQNSKEWINVEDRIENEDLSIEHIMPRKLNLIWEKSLGKNFDEIHKKYLHTIGNITLTSYNSNMSNKSFIEKRDMNNGYKESGYRLNNSLKNYNKWTEDEIKERAEELFKIALSIFKPIETKYSPKISEVKKYTLGDEKSFSNEKITSFSFLDNEYMVSTWKEFYIKVVTILYDFDKSIIYGLVENASTETYIKNKFSKDPSCLRSPYKFNEYINLEINTSTDSKLDILRCLFEMYEFELDDLSFTIK